MPHNKSVFIDEKRGTKGREERGRTECINNHHCLSLYLDHVRYRGRGG